MKDSRKFTIFYRDSNQKKFRIADLELTSSKFDFQYYDDAKIVFPGFPRTRHLWKDVPLDELMIRIPPQFREQNKNQIEIFSDFVRNFKGRIVTDRFEFQPVR